ncbi:MAG: hypothetical protein LRY43_04260 [Gammaproteobacteria bacterium]|nr:hypothetical protein [Gammaproteobacteria bacterium]
MLIATYWALDNSLKPFVLKMIIDKTVALNSDKSAIFATVLPYILLYITMWILVACDMRFLDWIKLKFFYAFAIRYYYANVFLFESTFASLFSK